MIEWFCVIWRMNMSLLLRDTYVEVNLDNIAYNMKSIKSMLGSNVKIAAVLKADAYGHGAIEVAKTVMENGAEYIAVATLNEALEIRKRFNDYRIFIMGFTPDKLLEYVVKNDITQSIFSYKQAKLLSELGYKYNKVPVVHIKYDTGFNRLGFRDSTESIEEIARIAKIKNINVEGIFSHLALAGREGDEKQYKKFVAAINRLKEMGIDFKYKHIEDSISAVDYPEYRFNMIRPGAIIYGIKGFQYGSLDLKQSLTFKSKISYVKEILEGEGVSYDYLWKAQRRSIIGTLPVGYADGYPRNLSNKGYVTVHGKRAPIVGLICMDQLMVDLTDIPEAKEGDEVVLFSNGEDNTMDLNTMARLAGTNKNEIITRISRRVPRVYIKGGKIMNVLDYVK